MSTEMNTDEADTQLIYDEAMIHNSKIQVHTLSNPTDKQIDVKAQQTKENMQVVTDKDHQEEEEEGS